LTDENGSAANKRAALRRRPSLPSIHSWAKLEDVVSRTESSETVWLGSRNGRRVSNDIGDTSAKPTAVSSASSSSTGATIKRGREASGSISMTVNDSDPLFADFVKLLKRNDINIPYVTLLLLLLLLFLLL
jgi:hypothetical protein